MREQSIGTRWVVNETSQKAEPTAGEAQKELRAQLQSEWNDIRSGKEENALLITALANNWSADQIRSVALRRGKNWRFLSALTDQMLQVEGWALLSFASTAIGSELVFVTLKKVLAVLDRSDALMAELEAAGKLDARRVKLIEDTLNFLEQLAEQSRQAYFSRMAGILGGNHGDW